MSTALGDDNALDGMPTDGAGLASFAEDVTPELVRATIKSITVLGVVQASAAVKKALADRAG